VSRQRQVNTFLQMEGGRQMEAGKIRTSKEVENQSSEIRYMYYTVETTRGRGVITVAFQVAGDWLNVGAAFCSPKEKHFHKKKIVVNGVEVLGGREIAESRLVPVVKKSVFFRFTPAIVGQIAITHTLQLAKSMHIGWMTRVVDIYPKGQDG
jgi:hypothetical protein